MLRNPGMEGVSSTDILWRIGIKRALRIEMLDLKFMGNKRKKEVLKSFTLMSHTDGKKVRG